MDGEVDSIFIQKKLDMHGIRIIAFDSLIESQYAYTPSLTLGARSNSMSLPVVLRESKLATQRGRLPSIKGASMPVLGEDESHQHIPFSPLNPTKRRSGTVLSIESLSSAFKLDLAEDRLYKCLQMDLDLKMGPIKCDIHEWALACMKDMSNWVSKSLDAHNRQVAAITFYQFIRKENGNPAFPVFNDVDYLLRWFYHCLEPQEKHKYEPSDHQRHTRQIWRRLIKKILKYPMHPRYSLVSKEKGTFCPSQVAAANRAREMYIKALTVLLSDPDICLDAPLMESLRFLDVVLASEVRHECRLQALEKAPPETISMHHAQALLEMSPLMLDYVSDDEEDEQPMAINLELIVDSIHFQMMDSIVDLIDKTLLSGQMEGIQVNFTILDDLHCRVLVDNFEMKGDDGFNFRFDRFADNPVIEVSVKKAKDMQNLKAEIDAILQHVTLDIDLDWILQMQMFFSNIWPSQQPIHPKSEIEQDLIKLKNIRERRLLAPLREMIEKEIFCLYLPVLDWGGAQISLHGDKSDEFRLEFGSGNLLRSEFSDVYTSSHVSRKLMRYVATFSKMELVLYSNDDRLYIVEPFSFLVDIHQDVQMPVLQSRTEVRVCFNSQRLLMNVNPEILKSVSDLLAHSLLQSDPIPAVKASPEFLKFDPTEEAKAELNHSHFTSTSLLFEVSIPDNHSIEIKVEVDTPRHGRAAVLDIRWENKLFIQVEQSDATSDITFRAPPRSTFKTKLIGFGVNEETIISVQGGQGQISSRVRNPFAKTNREKNPEANCHIIVESVNVALCKQCVDAMYYIQQKLIPPKDDINVSFVEEDVLEPPKPPQTNSMSYSRFEIGRTTVRIFQFGKKSDEQPKRRYILGKLILGGFNLDMAQEMTTCGINTIDLYEQKPTRVWDNKQLLCHWSRIFETEKDTGGVFQLNYSDSDYTPTLCIRIFSIRVIMLHRFIDAMLEMYYGFYEHNEELFGPKQEACDSEDFVSCEVQGAGDADGVYERISATEWVQHFGDDKIVLCKEEEWGTSWWFLKMPLPDDDEIVIAYIESEEALPWLIKEKWKVSTGAQHEPKELKIHGKKKEPEQSKPTMKFSLQFIQPKIFIPTRTNSNRFLMYRMREIDIKLPQSFLVDEEYETPPFFHMHCEETQMMTGMRMKQHAVQITGEIIDLCDFDVKLDWSAPDVKDLEIHFLNKTSMHLTEEQYTFIWDAYVDWEANIYESWPHADLFWDPCDTGYPLWMKVHLLWDQLDLVLYYGEDNSEPMVLIHARDLGYQLSLSNVQSSVVSFGEVVMHDVRERAGPIVKDSQVKYRKTKYGPWFTAKVIQEANEENKGSLTVCGEGGSPEYVPEEKIRRNKNQFGHRLILMAMKDKMRKQAKPALLIKIRRNFIGAMQMDITARDAHVHLPEMSLIQDIKVMMTGRYKYLPCDEPERNLALEPEPPPVLEYWYVKNKIKLEKCKIWLPEREAQACELPEALKILRENTDQDDEFDLEEWNEQETNVWLRASRRAFRRNEQETDRWLGASSFRPSSVTVSDDSSSEGGMDINEGLLADDEMSTPRRLRTFSHSREAGYASNATEPLRKRNQTILAVDIGDSEPKQSIMVDATSPDAARNSALPPSSLELQLPSTISLKILSDLTTPRRSERSASNMEDLSISFGDAYNHDKQMRKRRFSTSPDMEIQDSQTTEYNEEGYPEYNDDDSHVHGPVLAEWLEQDAVRNDRFCVTLTGTIQTHVNMSSDFSLSLDLESIAAKQMFGATYWNEVMQTYLPHEMDFESSTLHEYFDDIEERVSCLHSTQKEHIFAIPEVGLKVVYDTKPFGSDPLDTDQDLHLEINLLSDSKSDVFELVVSPDFGFLVGIGDMLGKVLSDCVPPFEDEIVYSFPTERVPNNTNRWGLDVNVRFPKLSIMLIDSVFGSLLNLAKLDIMDMEIRGSTKRQESKKQEILMKGLVKFGMQMQYWNYRLETYEPLIERVDFRCDMSAPTFDIYFIKAETPQMFNLNISNIALENIARISKFLTRSREESDKFLRNKDYGALDPCRFKIQNKCGKQIRYCYSQTDPEDDEWEICPHDKTCNIFTADRHREDKDLWVRWWEDSTPYKVDLMSVVPRYWNERHCEFLSHIDETSRKRTLVVHSMIMVKNTCAATVIIQINEKATFQEKGKSYLATSETIEPNSEFYVPVTRIRNDSKRSQKRLHMVITKLHEKKNEDDWARSPVQSGMLPVSPQQSISRQKMTAQKSMRADIRPGLMKSRRLSRSTIRGSSRMSLTTSRIFGSQSLLLADQMISTYKVEQSENRGIPVTQQPKLGSKGILKKLVFHPPNWHPSTKTLHPLYVYLKITQQSKSEPKIFTITPRVVLRNKTPVQIFFQVYTGDTEDQKRFLKHNKRTVGLTEAEGGSVLPAVERQLLTADDSSTLRLGLTEDQIENASVVPIHPKKKSSESVKLTGHERALRVTWKKEGSIMFVEVSFNYWLYNLTDFKDLVYAEDTKGVSKHVIDIPPVDDSASLDAKHKLMYCYGHLKEAKGLIGFKSNDVDKESNNDNVVVHTHSNLDRSMYQRSSSLDTRPPPPYREASRMGAFALTHSASFHCPDYCFSKAITPKDIFAGKASGEIEVLKQMRLDDNRMVTAIFPLGVQVTEAGTEWGETKIISIVPQFVLVNTIAGKNLFIRQTGTKRNFRLQTGEKFKQFFWVDSEHARKIEFSFQEDADVWSSPFAFAPGEHSVWCLYSSVSDTDDNRKWLHVTVRKEENVMLIMFEEGDDKYPPYRIDNDTLFTIEICQQSKKRWRNLLPHQNLSYCWDDPTAKHALLLRIEEFSEEHFTIPLDGVNHRQEIQGLPGIEANARKIYVNISTDGPTKVLYLGHIHHEHSALKAQHQQTIERRIKKLESMINYLESRIQDHDAETPHGSKVRQIPEQYANMVIAGKSTTPRGKKTMRMTSKVRKLGIVGDEPTFRYQNRPKPTLEVKISEAANLISMDNNGLSDPFVIVRYNKEEKKTAVRKKTLNPTWKDANFSFDLASYAFGEGEELELEIRDKDFMSSEFLGMVYIDIAQILEQAGEDLPVVNKWYAVQERRHKPKKDRILHGKLHVEILIIRNSDDLIKKSSAQFTQEIEAKKKEILSLEGHLKVLSEENYKLNVEDLDALKPSSKTEIKIDTGELSISVNSAYLPDMNGCTMKYQLVHGPRETQEEIATSRAQRVENEIVSFERSEHTLHIESGKTHSHTFHLKLFLCHTVKDAELIGECTYDLNETLVFSQDQLFQVHLPIKANAMDLRKKVLEAEKENHDSLNSSQNDIIMRNTNDRLSEFTADSENAEQVQTEHELNHMGYFVAHLKWIERSETQTLFKKKVLINLAGLSLSLIDSNYYSEIAYASIRNINLDLSETEESQDLWFTVEDIQIDNSEWETKFPVVFSLNRQNFLTSHLPLIQLSINRSLQKASRKVTVYPYIAFLIQELDIVLESRWILDVRLWAFEVMDILRNITGNDARDFSIQVPKLPDVQESESDKVYVETLSMSPLKVRVSSHHAGKSSKPNNSPYVNTILNLQPELHIQIEALLLEHTFCSHPMLISSIRNHISSRIYRQIAVNFGAGVGHYVGDPLFLFENIAVGVGSFFYEPVSGIIHRNPKAVGKGIVRGTTSLLGHTVGGVMASTSGVTTIAQKAVMGLTIDSDFQHAFLNDIAEIEAGATIGKSALIAGKGVVKGISSGLVGLILDPYTGARANGVKGLFGGVAKGIIGVALKPIAGVLHGTSALTGGIKNFALNVDKVVIKKQRIRYPRVFEMSGIFSKYNPARARANFILKTIDKRFVTDHFKSTLRLDSTNELIISSRRILFIKVKDMTHLDEFQKTHMVEFQNLVDVRANNENHLILQSRNGPELQFDGIDPTISAKHLAERIKHHQSDWRRSGEERGAIHSSHYDEDGFLKLPTPDMDTGDSFDQLMTQKEIAEQTMEGAKEEIHRLEHEIHKIEDQRLENDDEFFRVKLKIEDCDAQETVFSIAAAVGNKHSDVKIAQQVVLEGITELMPIQVKCIHRETTANLGSVRIELSDVPLQPTKLIFQTKQKLASEDSHKLHITLSKHRSQYMEVEENDLQKELENQQQKLADCKNEIKSVESTLHNRSLVGHTRLMNQRKSNQDEIVDRQAIEAYTHSLHQVFKFVEQFSKGTMTLELNIGKYVISESDSKKKGKYYVQITHEEQKLKTKSIKTVGPWPELLTLTNCELGDSVQFKLKKKGKVKKTLLASTSLRMIDLCLNANVEEDGKLMWLKLSTAVGSSESTPVLGLRIRIEGFENHGTVEELTLAQDICHQNRKFLGWKDQLIQWDMKEVLLMELESHSEPPPETPVLSKASSSNITNQTVTPSAASIDFGAEIQRLKEEILKLQSEKEEAEDMAEQELLQKQDEIMMLKSDLDKERKEKEALKEEIRRFKMKAIHRRSFRSLHLGGPRKSYTMHLRNDSRADSSRRPKHLTLRNAMSLPAAKSVASSYASSSLSVESDRRHVLECMMESENLPSVEDGDFSSDAELPHSADPGLHERVESERKSRLLGIGLRRSAVKKPRRRKSSDKQRGNTGGRKS